MPATAQRNRRAVVDLLLGAVLLAALLPISVVAQERPMLIPQPRELQAGSGSFRATPNLQIVLPAATAYEDREAARSLNEELEGVTGSKYAIVSSVPTGDTPAILLGRLDQSPVKEALGKLGLSADGIGAQGYALDVAPDRIVIGGRDSAGLFYGVQTLKQLLVGKSQEAQFLAARVRDWPSLEYRGTQVDMSRGPVPKLSYLKGIVRTIAEFKMNQLYMYIEDSFRMDGQPLVGVLSDTLSRQDWKDLVAYAARYHVEIVPATEACGHLHKILRFEQYTGMAERPHGHVLAEGDPQAAAFLNDMYGQMAPVFPSPIYNIGCDETQELGKGRTADLVKKEGYGRAYVDSVVAAENIVHRYNKQVMIWGDIAVEHPEMIPSLPRDLIVASWEYGPHPSYERWVKPFVGTGLKIFVCPWAGNTRVIVPDYEEAAYNIEGFITDGRKAGAIGTEVTVWNDNGESLYGPNWWSIVYGAACAWEPGKTDVQDFNQKFDWAFFRNTDHRFAQAIWQLGHINEVIRAGKPVETYDVRFGGANMELFWHDPFSPVGQADAERILPVASDIRHTAEQAYTVFATSENRGALHPDVLADLEYEALKIDALAMRYQFMQEIAERYASAAAGQRGDFSDIQSTNGRLEDLRDYTTKLRELYKQRWMAENLDTWMPNMLQLYDRNSQMWQDEIAKFRDLRYQIRGKGLPPADSLGLLPVKP